ncbi:hypothetical protein YC2023_018472 [Brassica napus]
MDPMQAHFLNQIYDNSFYLKSDDQSNNSSGSYGISIIPVSLKPCMFVSSSAPRTYTIYFKVKRGPKWRGVLLSLHAVMKDLRVAFDLASEVPNGEEFYCLSML